MLAAVGLLSELYHGSRRKLASRVPTLFLRRAWRSRVKAGPDGFDLRAYEVAVIVHLRDRLRAELWCTDQGRGRSNPDPVWGQVMRT